MTREGIMVREFMKEEKAREVSEGNTMLNRLRK
jgi:hypothetical protein